MASPGQTAQEGQTGNLISQSDRCYFEERFLLKPGINADIGTTDGAVRTIANPNFEVLGTNSSTDDVTFDVEGGIKCETDGTSLDDIIILPHLDTTQTAWTAVEWDTSKQVSWGCIIETGASISAIIWAGLKLTNTDVIATDADQTFFRYQTAVSSGLWTMNDSTANTDNSNNTDVTVAVSTQYKLEIKIDADRKPHYLIDGKHKGTGAALTADINLIPYIAITQIGGSAVNHIIRRQWISRSYT